MKAIARGCLELIIVWTLVGLALYYLFDERFTEPGPRWGAVIGGALVAGAWGLLRNAFQARGQAKLIRGALRGDWPRDGWAYAAVGPAVPVGDALVTPFQKRPCVLYSYELSKTERVSIRTSKGTRSENRRTVYLSGVCMNPWAVRTQAGDVKVVGFPIPDDFPEHTLSAREHGVALRDFTEQTQFTRVGKWEIGKLFKHAGAILGEDDGQLREDLWFSEADMVLSDPRLLAECKLIEQYIPVDKTVCVIGSYEMNKGGLVNNWSQGGLQVIFGDAQAAIQKLKVRWQSYLVFALLLAGVGTGLNYGLLRLRESSLKKSEDGSALIEEQLIEAVQSGDLDGVSQALESGASLEVRDQSGRPLLLIAVDREHDDVAWKLIESGCDINAEQSGWKRTALEAAFDHGNRELVDVLIQREAKGVFASSLSPEIPVEDRAVFVELLNAYSDSLQSSNPQRIEDLVDDWPADYLESVGRGLYSNTRPIQWQIDQGYWNDDVATVIATGTNSYGALERYVVTFVRKSGKWRIRRDYWDQTFSFQF